MCFLHIAFDTCVVNDNRIYTHFIANMILEITAFLVDSAKERWLALLITSISVVPVLTYALTTVCTKVALNRPKDGCNPPILPYLVPFMGHSIPFLVNTGKFIDGTRYGPSNIGNDSLGQTLKRTIDADIPASLHKSIWVSFTDTSSRGQNPSLQYSGLRTTCLQSHFSQWPCET